MAIYDYNKQYVKKNEYPPSTHFFIKDRNTAEYNGDKTDLPEQYYGYGETRHSILLQKIQANSLLIFSQFDMVTLQEFVLSLFWRIPANDISFIEQFQQNSVLNNSFKIFQLVAKNSLEENEYKSFLNTEAFIKLMRPTVAGTFLLANKGNDFNKWQIIYNHNANQLCSDNPILLKDKTSIDIFQTDLVMPLSKHHLLVKTDSKVIPKQLTSEFSFLVDLLTFKQGITFCCSAKRSYIQAISHAASGFTDDQLRNRIFQLINSAH